MVKTAHEKGINFFSLSEKENPIEAYCRIEKLCKDLGMLAVPAQEVPSYDGDMLGIGITERIENPRKYSCFEIADMIKERAGKAVATHPNHPGSLSREMVLDMYRNNKIVAGDFVTGAVDYFLKSHHDRNLSWAKKNMIPRLGFSDAKTVNQVGTCTTLYELEEFDIEHLLKKIEQPVGIIRRPSLRASIEKTFQTYRPNKNGMKGLVNRALVYSRFK